jgi:hypothetical protein
MGKSKEVPASVPWHFQALKPSQTINHARNVPFPLYAMRCRRRRDPVPFASPV